MGSLNQSVEQLYFFSCSKNILLNAGTRVGVEVGLGEGHTESKIS